MDHCNDASQTVKKSGEGMKVEKDEFLIDGGKSAMITMRWRPMADRSRVELWQLSSCPLVSYNFA